MNWSLTMPDIPDDWKGGIVDTCKVLGQPGKPISKVTLRRYVALGRKAGGIGFKVSVSGRKVFTGYEIKRFWLHL